MPPLADSLFGQLTKIQLSPPRWNWVINGKDIELTKNQLYVYSSFKNRCLRYEQEWYPAFLHGVSWPEMSGEQWRQHVENASS
jgi:hypothetical protein